MQDSEALAPPYPHEERVSWLRPIAGFAVAGFIAFVVLVNVGRSGGAAFEPRIAEPQRDIRIPMLTPDGPPLLGLASEPLLPVIGTTRPARVTAGTMQVSGRLPKEVIGRIVRQNQGRFRLCYAGGLARNPNLTGRVNVRFVIGRGGAVSYVSNGGSDLPDAPVVRCILQAFEGLSFPQPEGGIVTVTYPIFLQPGS